MEFTSTPELAPSGAFRSVLKQLGAEEIERLRLRPVQWEAGQRIGCMGQQMRHIAFLESGAASLMVAFQDGRQVEAGFLDAESIIGLTALLGETISLQNVVMQVAGYGYLCRRDDAVKEFARSQRFQRLALDRAVAQITETMQLVGCYATHPISQRLSRWLLTYQDRTGCDVVAVTQEVLSQILGATRPAISIVSEMFARLGLIQIRRGKIRVLDRVKLEAEACECYHILRESRGRLSPTVCLAPHRNLSVSQLPSSHEPFPVTRDNVSRAGMRRLGRYIQ